MELIRKIETGKAPKPIGPYSQAIAAGDFLFVAAQIGLDPATGAMVKGGVREQTEQALKNIAAILEEAGASLESVVKTEIFLIDLLDFKAVNEVYASHFPYDPKPARQTVQVTALPLWALVEISCIAYVAEKPIKLKPWA